MILVTVATMDKDPLTAHPFVAVFTAYRAMFVKYLIEVLHINQHLMQSFAEDVLHSLNLDYLFLFYWFDELHQTLLAQNYPSIPKVHLEKIIQLNSGQFAAIGTILVREQLKELPSFGIKTQMPPPPPPPRKPAVKDVIH